MEGSRRNCCFPSGSLELGRVQRPARHGKYAILHSRGNAIQPKAARWDYDIDDLLTNVERRDRVHVSVFSRLKALESAKSVVSKPRDFHYAFAT